MNTASRMESHGLPGEIQITERVAAALVPEFGRSTSGNDRGEGQGTDGDVSARPRDEVNHSRRIVPATGSRPLVTRSQTLRPGPTRTAPRTLAALAVTPTSSATPNSRSASERPRVIATGKAGAERPRETDREQSRGGGDHHSLQDQPGEQLPCGDADGLEHRQVTATVEPGEVGQHPDDAGSDHPEQTCDQRQGVGRDGQGSSEVVAHLRRCS